MRSIAATIRWSIFDRDGNVLRTWGEGVFKHAHGVHMGPDEAIYLTDDFDHTVRKCTLDGKVLLTIGVPGKPKPFMSGEPFRKCTHTALSPKGEIYVSDGYGNARVHKYLARRQALFSWGKPGAGPGEFNLPHNIACDADGWVYVADRENIACRCSTATASSRRSGTTCIGRAGCTCRPASARSATSARSGRTTSSIAARPISGRGSRSCPTKARCSRASRASRARGLGPGQYISPHGLAVDSRGDLYVGEVCYTAWSSLFPDQPRPKRIRNLQKYERVSREMTWLTRRKRI